MSNASSDIPPDVLKAATKLWQSAPGGHTMPVEGSSMRPLLRPGDTVFVAHQTGAVRPGDIIVFWHGHTPVVHRLIGVEATPDGSCLVPKGDNVAAPDASIEAGAVVGRVQWVQRGKVRLWLDDSTWQRAGKLWATAQAALTKLGHEDKTQAAIVRRLMLLCSWLIFTLAALVNAVGRRRASSRQRTL